MGLFYNENQGIIIDEIDIDSDCIEGEDIVAYRCQGIKGKGKKENGNFISIICYMTVEGPCVEENTNK